MRQKRFYYWLFAAMILAVLLVLQRAQRSTRDHPESVATAAAPLATPAGTVGDAQCRPFYDDTSIWNVPIDWSSARAHPASGQMMDAFFSGSDWIGSDTSQYTPNVYFVTSETPLVPVRLVKNRFRDAFNDVQILYSQPAEIVWMPLPAGALPARGTDGQLVVVNLDSGEEWGLNKGQIDRLGSWSAGGIYRYSIGNSGIPPEGFGQRGAGVGQLAGIVRRCEVERGRIGHAVTIAYDYPCRPEACQQNGWPASIPPFRKTDGRGESPFDIPEGARLAIRPEIPRDEIARACGSVAGCLVWVQNMQEYGGFIVDNSDHPKTYAEGDATASWSESTWSRDMLRNIPTDWYIVIDWNHPSTEAR